MRHAFKVTDKKIVQFCRVVFVQVTDDHSSETAVNITRYLNTILRIKSQAVSPARPDLIYNSTLPTLSEPGVSKL